MQSQVGGFPGLAFLAQIGNGAGVPDGVGVGVPDGVGVGVPDGVAVGAGVGVGETTGVLVGDPIGVGVGGVPYQTAKCSFISVPVAILAIEGSVNEGALVPPTSIATVPVGET